MTHSHISFCIPNGTSHNIVILDLTFLHSLGGKSKICFANSSSHIHCSIRKALGSQIECCPWISVCKSLDIHFQLYLNLLFKSAKKCIICFKFCWKIYFKVFRKISFSAKIPPFEMWQDWQIGSDQDLASRHRQLSDSNQPSSGNLQWGPYSNSQWKIRNN